MTQVIFFSRIDYYPYNMEQICTKQTTPLHQDWLRKLDFYHFELFILQEQLEEIVEENTESDISEKAGYFSNRLIIRKNHIDKLRNLIRENLDCLAFETSGEDDVENTLKIFDSLSKECAAQQQSVNELRKEFERFAIEWA